MRRGRSTPTTLARCAALALAGFASAGAYARPAVHFALSKSEPAAEATVPPPEEVRLWFTQAPQDNSMSVRLMADDAAVDTGPAIPDPGDGKVYSVAVGRTLGQGDYRVVWRAMAADGHVVRGEIPFAVEIA